MTDKGPVRGTVTADLREFQGIPYAAPPVRWGSLLAAHFARGRGAVPTGRRPERAVPDPRMGRRQRRTRPGEDGGLSAGQADP